MSRATYGKREGGIQIGSITVKRDTNQIIKIKGINRDTGRAVIEARQRLNEYEVEVRVYEREITHRQGNWVVLGKVYGGKTTIQTFSFAGSSKAQKGFESWCNNMAMAGLDSTKLNLLKELFATMTGSQKGQLFNVYNGRANARTYGSDTFDFMAELEGDVETYYEDMLNSIYEVMDIES